MRLLALTLLTLAACSADLPALVERDRDVLALVVTDLHAEVHTHVAPTSGAGVVVRPSLVMDPMGGTWHFEGAEYFYPGTYGQLEVEFVRRPTETVIPFSDFGPYEFELRRFPDSCFLQAEDAEPGVAPERDECLFIESALPIYTEDGQHAVVDLKFGPTENGASALYLVALCADGWRVLWRQVSRLGPQAMLGSASDPRAVEAAPSGKRWERDRELLELVADHLHDSECNRAHDANELHVVVAPTARSADPGSTFGSPDWRAGRVSVEGRFGREFVMRPRAEESLPIGSFERPGIVVGQVSDYDFGPFGSTARESSVVARPKACLCIETSLPVYSIDGRHALVFLGFGPTPHGASATYLLSRSGGRWSVLWTETVYFM